MKEIDNLKRVLGGQLDVLERLGLYLEHIYIHDEPDWGVRFTDPERPPRHREIVVEMTTKEPRYAKCRRGE